MPTHDLLRSQSNSILRAIQDAGMAKEEFEWSEVRSGRSSYKTARQLVHKSTGYYFIFDHSEGDMLNRPTRVARFSPGSEHESAYAVCSSWNEMLDRFTDWLKYILREIEPDLWSDDEEQEFQGEWLSSNKPFTPSEIQLIGEGLDRVEIFLIEHSDKTDKSLTEIKKEVKLLKEAAKKAGRRDWMLMFIGAIVAKLSDFMAQPVHWQQIVKVLLSEAKQLLSGG